MFKKWLPNKERKNTDTDEKSKKERLQEAKGLLEVRETEGEDHIIINGNALGSEEAQAQMIRELGKEHGIPYFDGEVENLYHLRRVKQHDHCPECGAEVVLHYGGFAYTAIGSPPRYSTSPAGYFCSVCPTVVVDEKLIEDGIWGGFKFIGVYAVETESHGTQIFQTLNGNKTLYVLNEDEEVEDLIEMDGSLEKESYIMPQRRINPKRKSKSRSRNKAAKAARKKRRK